MLIGMVIWKHQSFQSAAMPKVICSLLRFAFGVFQKTNARYVVRNAVLAMPVVAVLLCVQMAVLPSAVVYMVAKALVPRLLTGVRVLLRAIDDELQ